MDQGRAESLFLALSRLAAMPGHQPLSRVSPTYTTFAPSLRGGPHLMDVVV